MGKMIKLEEYEKVLEERDKLKELAFTWLRRYEGELQATNDSNNYKLNLCEKFRKELNEVKKK